MQSTVYREEHLDIAPGERIQFTAADKELGIRARDFVTVERLMNNGALSVRTDKGQTVELDPARARHIEYGYVVDGSRAVVADRVLLCVDTWPQFPKESSLYNALSRATHDARISSQAGLRFRRWTRPRCRPSRPWLLFQRIDPMARNGILDGWRRSAWSGSLRWRSTPGIGHRSTMRFPRPKLLSSPGGRNWNHSDLPPP